MWYLKNPLEVAIFAAFWPKIALYLRLVLETLLSFSPLETFKSGFTLCVFAALSHNNTAILQWLPEPNISSGKHNKQEFDQLLQSAKVSSWCPCSTLRGKRWVNLCFLFQNNFTVTISCLSVFQQGFGCSISQCWSFGFVLSLSDCDTLIGSLYDVLLAYLQSPNTSPTVSTELGKDPNLLACPSGVLFWERVWVQLFLSTLCIRIYRTLVFSWAACWK